MLAKIATAIRRFLAPRELPEDAGMREIVRIDREIHRHLDI